MKTGLIKNHQTKLVTVRWTVLISKLMNLHPTAPSGLATNLKDPGCVTKLVYALKLAKLSGRLVDIHVVIIPTLNWHVKPIYGQSMKER